MSVSTAGDKDIFVEELRFTSEFDGPVQLLSGLYLERNDFDWEQHLRWSGDPAFDPVIAGFFPTNPETGLPFETINTDNSDLDRTDQTAFFGELSYELSENIEATIGGRYFEYDQDIKRTQDGAFSSGSFVRLIDDKISGQNYKANITYTYSDDALVYAQWAEGFRLGGPQFPVRASCDADQNGLIEFPDGSEVAQPSAIAPDELESFEIGIKASLADNRITLNAALYRVNWDGIPVLLIATCQDGFTVNAGESTSEGIELEAKAHLTDSLVLDLAASYGEATLAEDADNLGFKGDNLPGSADFNFSASLQYSFNMAGYEAFVRGDYAYIGEYYHNIAEQGQPSGGYSQAHLKAGLAIDQVEVDLFIKNLTNADDFTWVETTFGPLGTNRAYRLRPRTIGLNISYKF